MKKGDYRCNSCGLILKEHELRGDILLCPECEGILDKGVFVERESRSTKQKASSKKEGTVDQEQEFYNFKCLSCTATIRILQPMRVGAFRCVKCGSKYQADTLTRNGNHFIIVPTELKKHEQQRKHSERRIVIPDHVLSALRVFGQSELLEKVELTKVFRKCVSEYHPDKVSHLGADLKNLAEAKTREYITAFELIKSFCEEQNLPGWG